MVYCVGLTGPIASGKSTVASYFAQLGITVIDADRIAKAITAPEQPAFHQIVQHFGTFIVLQNGTLDRARLRTIIFKNAQERRWLENLLHPLIRNQIETAIQAVTTPYCLIEIPLLSDRTHYPYLNRVLLVTTDKEQQIQRFIARDKGTRDDILAILEAQSQYNQRTALADDVLENTGSLETLSKNVRALHMEYLRHSQDS